MKCLIEGIGESKVLGLLMALITDLQPPMMKIFRSRQSITSSLSVASRSVVNRKKQRLVKVGTFNVRTLRTDFRAFELQKLAADLNIDVIVIQ